MGRRSGYALRTSLARLKKGDAAPAGDSHPSQPDDIALQFGGDFPEGEQAFVDGAEVDRCRSRALIASLRDGLWGEKPWPPCTHHLVMPISAVLVDGNHAENVRRRLYGRIVIVGLGTGFGDDHTIPGVGLLPGVAIHAMALDNLLTWGPDYRRWPPNFAWAGQIGWDEVLKLAVVFGMPILLAWRRTGSARQAKIWAKRALRQARRDGAFRVHRANASAHRGSRRRHLAGEFYERFIAWLIVADLLAFGMLVVGVGLFASWLGDWPVAVSVMLASLGLIVIEVMEPAEIRRAFDRLAGPWIAACTAGLLAVVAAPVMTVSLGRQCLIVALGLSPLIGLALFRIRRALDQRRRAAVPVPSPVAEAVS